MDTMTNNKLASFFSAVQVSAEQNGKPAESDFIEQVQKHIPLWERYVKEQVNLLNKGVKGFKHYDTRNQLAFLWMQLKKGQNFDQKKTFDLLSQFANEALQQQDDENALAMFNFIIFLFPEYYRVYIKVGELTQKLYGWEAASVFYQPAAALFDEPEILFRAAECEAKLGHYAEAKKLFEKTLASSEKNPEFANNADLQTQLKTLINAMSK